MCAVICVLWIKSNHTSIERCGVDERVIEWKENHTHLNSCFLTSALYSSKFLMKHEMRIFKCVLPSLCSSFAPRATWNIFYHHHHHRLENRILFILCISIDAMLQQNQCIRFLAWTTSNKKRWNRSNNENLTNLLHSFIPILSLLECLCLCVQSMNCTQTVVYSCTLSPFQNGSFHSSNSLDFLGFLFASFQKWI